MSARREKNARVGCRGGDYLMPTSFRGFSASDVRDVQRMYASQEWTQEQLAEFLGRSIATISRMVRCAPENVARVSRPTRPQLRRAQ